VSPTNDPASTNRIHPTAIIGDDVVLGVGNSIGPYSVLLGPCTIGDNNWIGPHVCIGTPPEMRGAPHPVGWAGDAGTGLVAIGSRNVIREFTAIHGPTTDITRVGNDCYVMNTVYIAHDCTIDDGATISSTVAMGGRTHLGAGSNIGLGAVIHQRTVIGPGAMIGMGAVVTKHIPPFALAYGTPARVRGANVVGLQRSGLDEAVSAQIDAALQAGDDLDALLPTESDAFRRAIAALDQPA
jgi:UDP-N-acetylglucosamine acyltransferase